MAAKRRHGVVISLDERRRQRQEESLVEANRKMIEAEHALFVALRLAGHRGPSTTMPPAKRPASVLVLPIRRRPKRAA